MKKFTEKLNDPRYQGPTVRIFRRFPKMIVRNPSGLSSANSANVRKCLGILRQSLFSENKISFVFQAKLSLYYTLVYPYLSYCYVIWSSTYMYVTNLNRILLLQERAVGAIANASYHSHSAPLFTKLKLKTFSK